MYERVTHPGSLVEVVHAATETATAYQVAVSKQALLRDCLRHSQGHYSPVEIEEALTESIELVPTQDGRLTTHLSLSARAVHSAVGQRRPANSSQPF